MINGNGNVKNWLTKVDMIMDLFGILPYVNVINHFDVGEYLDFKSFKCRKRLIDKLITECCEDINGNMIYNYEQVWNSYTIYIVLLVIFFIISIPISSEFI